jgi:hypothetical protein
VRLINMHELVLLSPYRFPAQYAMTMSDEDMASWLNAFTALWHPALLWQAKGTPRCETTYDHEQPKPGHIYALPETPPAYLSDGWEERVKQAGSLVFKATPDRHTTLANLQAALNAEGAPAIGWKQGLEISLESVGPFFGLAWGHQLLAALSEAMEHENPLDVAGFWDDVQQAIATLSGLTPLSPVLGGEGLGVRGSASVAESENSGGILPIPLTPDPSPTEYRGRGENHLKAAAARLQSAREVLYPVTIHLLDATFLDEATMALGWPEALEFGIATNFITATATLEKLAEHAPNRFAQLKTAVQSDQAEVCGGSYLER